MSFETWKEEFYPVPVEELPYNLTDEELILHSLKKWTGVLPENLKKHEVRYKHHTITPTKNLEQYLTFDTDTCSLCRSYYPKNYAHPCNFNRITLCPIVRATGKTCGYPWRYSHETNHPIVNLLKKTLEFVQNEENMS